LGLLLDRLLHLGPGLRLINRLIGLVGCREIRVVGHDYSSFLYQTYCGISLELSQES